MVATKLTGKRIEEMIAISNQSIRFKNYYLNGNDKVREVLNAQIMAYLIMMQQYAGTTRALDDTQVRLIAIELAQGEYSWMTFPDLWWVCMSGVKSKYDPDGLFGTIDPNKFFRWCNTHRDQRQEATRIQQRERQEEDLRVARERERIKRCYEVQKQKAASKTGVNALESSPNAIKNILGINTNTDVEKSLRSENTQLKERLQQEIAEKERLEALNQKLLQQIENLVNE